ncbi:DUF935 family protein [Zavarzinia sp.]|uniref:phage portal protein family protein n=1 Tax=Zavarzinia sp. TaxID=2027920 RepID=UPI003567BF50
MAFSDWLKAFQKAFRGTAGGRVITVPKADRIAAKLGAGPAEISAAMKGALHGDQDSFGDLCAMFDRYLLTEARLRSVYEKRRRKIVNRPWQVLPSADDPRGDEAADFAHRTLDAVPRFSRKVLYALTAAIGYGFQAVELDGHYDGQRLVLDSGRAVPAWALRHPQTAAGVVDNDNWEFKGELDWQPVPRGKLLVWELDEGGSYVTGGLMFPALWVACFKNFTIKDWISFLEVYGVPLRLAKYPANYDINSPEIEVLARAVIDIASDAGAIIPADMSIEFVKDMLAGSSEAFQTMCAYLDESLAELFLGGTLTTSAGEKGARSLGEVHQEETNEIVDWDARDLAEVLSDNLLKPLVIGAFGERPGYPQFTFDLTRIADLTKRSVIDTALLDRGVPMRADYFYETYAPGARPEEGDAVITRAAQPAPQQPLTAEASMFRVRKFETEAASPQSSVPASFAVFDALQPLAVDRLARPFDALIEAIVADNADLRVHEDLRGHEPRTRSEFEFVYPEIPSASFAREFAAALAPILSAAALAGIATTNDENRAKAPDIAAADVFAQAIDSLSAVPVMAESFGDTNSSPQRALDSCPRSTPRPRSPLLGALDFTAAGVDIPRDGNGKIRWDKVVPEKALEFWRRLTAVTAKQAAALDEAARRYAFTIAGQESARVVEAARAAIEKALADGGTVRDFSKTVRAAAKSAGVAPLDPWHLNLVYQQNVATAQGAGRIAVQRAPETVRLLPKLRYHGVGDDRERPAHRALNGMVKAANDPLWDTYYPPWEWLCRCWATSERDQPDVLPPYLPPVAEGFAAGSPLAFWKQMTRDEVTQ